MGCTMLQPWDAPCYSRGMRHVTATGGHDKRTLCQPGAGQYFFICAHFIKNTKSVSGDEIFSVMQYNKENEGMFFLTCGILQRCIYT